MRLNGEETWRWPRRADGSKPGISWVTIHWTSRLPHNSKPRRIPRPSMITPPPERGASRLCRIPSRFWLRHPLFCPPFPLDLFPLGDLFCHPRIPWTVPWRGHRRASHDWNKERRSSWIHCRCSLSEFTLDGEVRCSRPLAQVLLDREMILGEDVKKCCERSGNR
jgi:hypothetical protein